MFIITLIEVSVPEGKIEAEAVLGVATTPEIAQNFCAIRQRTSVPFTKAPTRECWWAPIATNCGMAFWYTIEAVPHITQDTINEITGGSQ